MNATYTHHDRPVHDPRWPGVLEAWAILLAIAAILVLLSAGILAPLAVTAVFIGLMVTAMAAIDHHRDKIHR